MLSTPRRILITGASRGIGRATAIALGARGHQLVLAARSEPGLRAVADAIEAAGGHAETAPLDLTDAGSVASATLAVLAKGPVDVLVNNAGIVDQAEFLLQSPESRAREMDVNYFGAQRMTRALLPSMIERGEGSIVNVSSLLGSVGTPTTANYSASKAALEAFSHALRGEVAHSGVRITVFVAPHTCTEHGERAEFRGVKSLPVEYVARELVRAIDSAPRVYAASPVYRLLLRLAALFPAFMEAQLLGSVRHRLRPARLAER